MNNLKKFIASESLGRIWTIRLNDLITGYAVLAFGFSFEHKGRDAFIDELFLKKSYRNRGFGKMTMNFIESEAKKLGVNVIHLEVENHNDAGNRLYIERGYSGRGRTLLSKKIS